MIYLKKLAIRAYASVRVEIARNRLVASEPLAQTLSIDAAKLAPYAKHFLTILRDY